MHTPNHCASLRHSPLTLTTHNGSGALYNGCTTPTQTLLQHSTADLFARPCFTGLVDSAHLLMIPSSFLPRGVRIPHIFSCQRTRCVERLV